MNNFHPLLQVALLANLDIQAVTSRYAVVQYVTKYMTKVGKGTLLAQAEECFDEMLAKAAGEGKGIGTAIAKFFNMQVAPRAISQLEVHHILWHFPPYLSSRGFTRISLNTELKKLKRPGEVRPKMDQDDEDATLTKQSVLDRYEHRGKELPPKGPHPISGERFDSSDAWQAWCSTEP